MKAFEEVGVSLNELLSKLGNLIQVTEVSGRIQYANDHWLDVLGYDEREAASINFFDSILHPRSRGDFMAVMKQLHCGDCVVDIEATLIRRNGQVIVVEGSLVPRLEHDQLQAIVGVFRDITTHHEAETELDRMFNMSVDMLGICDFDGIFQKLNPAWGQVLGYKIDELIGTPLINLVHPDDKEGTLYEALQAINSVSTNRTFENRYRCKDGSYRWLSWHYQTYPEKRKTYFIARDITEHRLADDRLREAKDQLQAILDNSATLISMKDLHGRYMLVNQEFAKQFGFLKPAHESFIGLTDFDLFPVGVAQTLQANDAQVLSAQAAIQFEEALPGSEATNTYLATKFLLHDATGKPHAVCTVATDITYRKSTEIQLLLRNQAIEFSPSGISIADASLPDMPLIYVNPAFERVTGYTPLESIGRNCRFLQGDDRGQPAIREIREAIQHEESCTVILRNYRKDGSLFYNELSLAPIHNPVGKLTHYVGISTDVTDRVNAEEKIQTQNQELLAANQDLALARKEAESAAEQIKRQNEKLVEANHALARARKQAEDATRLKSQFLATMSHELRTPLNAIIGYTEIQLAGMAGELTDEQRDYQERVLANADHLLELINDVLDISKIEAGRLEIVNKPFDLQIWISELVAQMKVLAEEKGLDFVISMDERIPQRIIGDPARIRQIATNLLSNAIKFTNEGHIHLRTRKHGRDAWKLIVEDTGIGIPSHLQETIFEEFRQVDSSSQRKVGGTGLGLSIVRKLALMMGGNVRVMSQVGKGSTFTIILPLEEEKFKQSISGAIKGDFPDGQ